MFPGTGFWGPYYLKYDSEKTCLFHIEDVWEKLAEGVDLPDDCPRLVFVVPECAALRTKPQVVSVQEIIDKIIRLYQAGSYYRYRGGEIMRVDRSRDDEDGRVPWVDLAGVAYQRDFKYLLDLLKPLDESNE